MTQQTKTFLKSFLIVFLFSASVVAIAEWSQAPAGAPPYGNVPIPLNVGSEPMMRTGATVFGNGLRSVGLFIANGNAQFDGDINVGGSIKVGNTTERSEVNDGASPSAQFEVASTTKGFLPPRMTYAQRNAIVAPATGLLIFQTNNLPGFYYFNGAAWVQLAPAKDGESGL